MPEVRRLPRRAPQARFRRVDLHTYAEALISTSVSWSRAALGPGCVKTRSIVDLIACAMARARIWRIGAVKFRESSAARCDDILRHTETRLNPFQLNVRASRMTPDSGTGSLFIEKGIAST